MPAPSDQGQPAKPGSRGWRHGRSLLLITAAVALAHLWLTWEVAQQMQDLAPGEGGIKRMNATYVSELKLSAPPVVRAAPAPKPQAAPAAPAKAKANKGKKPVPPDKAASTPPEAASAPELADAASAALAAASAADGALKAAAAASAAEAASAVAQAEAAKAASAAAAVAQAASAAAGRAASVGPVFEWPKATRVSYKMEGNYRGPIYGQASVEWVRQAMRYQVRVEASVGPSFAPLGSWRLTSEGDIKPEGLSPTRYENFNRLLVKSSPVRAIQFEDKEVLLPDGRRLPRLPEMQDPASQFIQLAYRFMMNPAQLKPGNTVEMPIVWLKKTEVLLYDVLNEETLRTPLGDIATVHVRPRRAETDPANGMSAEIWFAPGLQYLPIRILTRLDEKTFMDMQMDRSPQQTPADAPDAGASAAAAPGAAAPAASAGASKR
jgi:hypothetical protein